MYCIAQGRPCTSHKDVLVRPCITLRENKIIIIISIEYIVQYILWAILFIVTYNIYIFIF